jgi:hypothetical protein
MPWAVFAVAAIAEVTCSIPHRLFKNDRILTLSPIAASSPRIADIDLLSAGKASDAE